MSSDLAYYRRRALQERECAAKANSSVAANVHQELARHYEKLVARAEMQPLVRASPANENVGLTVPVRGELPGNTRR